MRTLLLAVFDAGDVLRRASEGLARALAWPAHQLCGLPSATLIPSDGLEAWRAALARSRREPEQDHRFKTTWVDRQGRLRNFRVELRGHPLRSRRQNAEGACGNLLAGFEELPTAARIEPERDEANPSLQRLLAMLPEPAAIGMNGRVRYANPAMHALLSVAPGTLIDRRLRELVHTVDVVKLQTRLRALAEGKRRLPAWSMRVRRALEGHAEVIASLATLDTEDGPGQFLLVLRDVSELRRSETELSEHRAELQRLLAAQRRTEERERQRIARELHDDLLQNLAAMTVELSLLRNKVPANAVELRDRLGTASARAGEMIAATRSAIAGLRPQLLDDLGLGDALRSLASDFEERCGAACDVEILGDAQQETAIPKEMATALYRVVQESLQNVQRHASARRVECRLDLRDSETIRLSISDDGIGLHADALRKPAAYGLMGIRERARELGGELSLLPNIRGGLHLLVTLPRHPQPR